MRKIYVLALLPALLSACALDLTQLLRPAAPSPSPAPTATHAPPADTPTFTPTIPTATFTLTPTPLGGEPTETEFSAPVTTPTFIQLVRGSALTQTSHVQGFVSIILSAPQVYWGDCNLSRATITAQVSEPIRVVHVLLFLKLKSKIGPGATDWDSGTPMTVQGSGTFSHIIEAEDIQNYFNYADAWIYLQLVSADGNGRVIDRTPVFSENLALSACP